MCVCVCVFWVCVCGLYWWWPNWWTMWHKMVASSIGQPSPHVPPRTCFSYETDWGSGACCLHTRADQWAGYLVAVCEKKQRCKTPQSEHALHNNTRKAQTCFQGATKSTVQSSALTNPKAHQFIIFFSDMHIFSPYTLYKYFHILINCILSVVKDTGHIIAILHFWDWCLDYTHNMDTCEFHIVTYPFSVTWNIAD
jgi:hypothetical protein